MIHIIQIFSWCIWPFLLTYYLFSKCKFSPFVNIYFYFLFYQILLSILLIFTQIYRWDYGDLYLYYDVPTQLIQNECLIYFDCQFPFSNSYLISYLHSFLFFIFPPSLIGIGIFGGTLAAFSYILLIESLRDIIQINKLYVFFLLFLPCLHLMAAYSGKDSYTFFLSVLCFISFNNILLNYQPKRFYLLLLTSLFFIFLIRSHQLFFYLFPILIIIFFDKFSFSFINKIFFSIFLIFLLLISIFFFFLDVDLKDFNNFLSASYPGGNLRFDTLICPLSFFHLFRPFPWEVNSFLYLFISFEKFLCLLILIFNLLIFIKLKYYTYINTNKLYKSYHFYFLSVSFFYILIYGFSSNIGDLIRRHIYFYPFLLLCFLPPKNICDFNKH